MAFGHLHVHSDYSALDGLGKVEQYVIRAKELGQDFIALTDHGNTSGLHEFQKAGDKHGIHTILGSEFYLQTEEEKIGHLILLAKNNNGLENLFKLQEYAYINNFYKKPRINMEVLALYSDDLICTSACIANPICQCIMRGDIESAKQYARKFKEIFKEDFYLEIQPNEVPAQININKTLIRIGKELNIPIVACNDSHYVLKEDSYAHEVLIALQTKKKMIDPKRFKFPGDSFYLKSEKEMKEDLDYVNSKDINSAIFNTTIISNKCNARLEKGNYLPKFPKVENEDEKLRQITYEQYNKEVIKKGIHTDKFLSDVENELDIIARNGYSGYFLIVQEYVNWARNNKIIVGDGRGSGAGSKVGYITRIHRINPDEHNLLFERFMADDRKPDIDVDFSDIDKVFEHLQEIYGEKNVARITAFATLTAKACTRKVMSCFNHPQSLISKICGLFPNRITFTLEEALNESLQLRKYSEKYDKEFNVIKKFEGIISHESQHAGGIIIYNDLAKYLPIKSNAEDRNKRIVGFDMNMLEELGHFKFDVLGLKTLQLLDKTLQMIETTEGVKIDLHSIDYEDQNVYKMLQEGKVSGVFQLSEQVYKVKEQKPNCFADLIAINALIRPKQNWAS